MDSDAGKLVRAANFFFFAKIFLSLDYFAGKSIRVELFFFFVSLSNVNERGYFLFIYMSKLEIYTSGICQKLHFLSIINKKYSTSQRCNTFFDSFTFQKWSLVCLL